MESGTLVHLDNDQTVVFMIIHINNNMAWVHGVGVRPTHHHNNAFDPCWCSTDKLVNIERLTLVVTR